LEIAHEIQKSDLAPASKKQQHFTIMYPEFAEKYPTLFQIACAKHTDLTHLKTMCDLLQTDDRETASAKVGQILFDEYVKPVLPPENKKRKRL
jgi:hypothetical protein